MAIVAIPEYLGNNFSSASPGLRFGMYFQGWTNEWKKHVPDQRKNEPPMVKSACKLNENDMDGMQALYERQQLTFDATSGLKLDAKSIAPFTTGLGNEHPTENGFSFLNPYGLPYLPGSGVKGVLRQAARELKSGEWGSTDGWDNLAIACLFGIGASAKELRRNKWNESDILTLFRKKKSDQIKDNDTVHLSGALTFWDVIPQIKGDSLTVEIMTPHQKHYYQKGENPHDSGQPSPLTFLTVPPDSGFTFHVQCNQALLKTRAPELADSDQWKELLLAAFEHAFNWLGFGAKTSVGYGAMEEDLDKKRERQEQLHQQQEAERQARERAERQREIERMNPVDKAIAECLDTRSEGQPEINALLAGLKENRWDEEIAVGVARNLKERMLSEKKWREKSEKKNPQKDKNYVNTQFVMKYLEKPNG